MTTPLGDIKQPAAGADLTLGAKELGDKLVAALQGLKVIDKVLVISNPIFGPRAGDQSWLDISGTGRGILAGDGVTLHLRLFDGPKGERECLMRLESPGKLDDLVAGWLSSFDTDPWEVLTALEGVKWCVVSSRDFTADIEPSAMLPPDGWPGDLPLREMAAGVICSAQTVDYDADFVAEVGTKIGTSVLLLHRGTAVVRLAPPEPESKPRREAVHMLRLRPAQVDTKALLPGFAAQLAGAELLLPLDDDGLTGPRVCLPGQLTIGAAEGQPSFEVIGAFDLVSETVTARLKKPPALTNLPGLKDVAPAAPPAAEWFGNLIKRATAQAWIVLNWSSDKENDPDRETVLAIGGAVGFDEKAPIELVPGRLTFAPSLMVEVEHPFTPEQRQLSGRMEGNLTLLDGGNPAFSLTGSVEIPGWYFTAEAETQIGNLVGALGLGEIALPETLKNATVDLKLAGDVETKSFTAALGFEQAATWKDDAMGWALSKLTIGVDYDGENDELGFGVSAILAFRTFDFEVSGGYDGGWALRGAMKDEGTLDVSQAINGLLNGLTFPKGMPPGLVLKDVGFAAKFSANSVDFSVRGRTAKEWGVIEGDPGLKLSVEALEFERTKEGTSATFAVRLTLGSVDILLEASTPKGTDAGWEFQGSTGRGQKIPIGTLIKEGVKLFDSNVSVPPALEGFTIENLGVSFNTASKDFTFTCEGKFKVEQTDVDCVVTIKITHDKNATKPNIDFLGKVTVGNLPVMGRISSDIGATRFLLTYGPGISQKLAVKDLVKDISPDVADAMPELTIGLKDALFAYEKTGKSSFLVGAGFDIGATIDTSKWGVIGSLFGKQEIGLDDLRVLVASADFNTGQVEELTKLLPGGIKLLPIPSSEEAGKSHGEGAPGSKAPIAISKGFNLSGNLKLGSLTPPPLMLPAAGGSKAPATTVGKPEGGKETAAEASTAKWIDIKKSLGPLYLSRVGFQYQDQKIGVLLDAAVDLAGLHVGLNGFQIRFPLSGSFDPLRDLDLDGLELAYATGPVQITGSFLRFRQAGKPDQYDGMALIKAANFMIAGLGSYATVADAPSMFIYAVLHAELGGPPFFRVQGLAAGFGYNRKLTLPPIEEVHTFALVRAALDETFIARDTPINEVLGKLRDYISPSLGDYWLAAGIRFSSFEMIQAFALLSVSFGHEVEIGLLGLAKMSLPRGAPPGSEVAYAELALKVVVKPEEGTVAVEGRLTDASYILSKNCRLTGGFAFFLWCTGEHAGDFVVTLGGYHPKFVRPAHYPIVPRLGIHWKVSKELLVTAEMYFALTPSCLMAGGKLSATYSSGSIRASFVAYADFLLNWEPLYYTADMGVLIALSVNLELVSINVQLSVDVHLWGPPFSGQIDVDLDVISFTVRFGDPKTLPPPLKPSEFKEKFLPPTLSDVLVTQISSGLIREKAGKNALRVVSAHALTLSVRSLIPVTKFEGIAANSLPKAAEVVGVRPMGKTKLESRLSVSSDSIDAQQKNRKNLRVSSITNGVPEALWGKAPEEGKVTLPTAEAKPPISTTVGVQISFAPIDPKGALPAMDIKKFAYETLNKPIPWDDNLKQTDPITATEKHDLLIACDVINESGGVPPRLAFLGTVEAVSVTSKRNAILEVLAYKSPFELNRVNLSLLGERRESYFQADPEICRTGEAFH